MLTSKESMKLIADLRVFNEKYYDELKARAYIDREEVGISRMFINKIIIEMDNVLDLTVRFTEKEYRSILTYGVDRAVLKAIKEEFNEIDEVNNFEHALKPEDYKDEKDLANEQLLEWVMMDVLQMEQMIDGLEAVINEKG